MQYADGTMLPNVNLLIAKCATFHIASTENG
jgi:hypothetical protein